MSYAVRVIEWMLVGAIVGAALGELARPAVLWARSRR